MEVSFVHIAAGDVYIDSAIVHLIYIYGSCDDPMRYFGGPSVSKGAKSTCFPGQRQLKAVYILNTFHGF